MRGITSSGLSSSSTFSILPLVAVFAHPLIVANAEGAAKSSGAVVASKNDFDSLRNVGSIAGPNELR
ncbi:MAG: hypothetical protein IPF87_01975 [Gemmatimonadetes bacterium]|nr:hypothetical protein [Gemmatimonadota bacterium]